MSEQAIREAAGHVTGAANSIELTIGEIMVAFREGRLGPEPAGSPAYARRLRDRYVGQALAGLCGNLDGARATAEIDKGTDVTETMGVTAKAFANAAIRALGYQVPEDGEVNS